MPCPCISVKYKLPTEEFIRAGYVNYWDPKNLIVKYAVSSLGCIGLKLYFYPAVRLDLTQSKIHGTQLNPKFLTICPE